MECLYKTSTMYNYEEIKRYSWSIMFSRKRIILLTLAELWILIGGIVLKNDLFVVFAIVYPIMLFIFGSRDIKRTYNSNKSAQNLCVEFEFYDTYFTETNETGETRLEYTKLHKIIETKTNFYLMIAKNQGFILNKANVPEGLDEFLRGIIKNGC